MRKSRTWVSCERTGNHETCLEDCYRSGLDYDRLRYVGGGRDDVDVRVFLGDEMIVIALAACFVVFVLFPVCMFTAGMIVNK